jgi:hypothetical protein
MMDAATPANARAANTADAAPYACPISLSSFQSYSSDLPAMSRASGDPAAQATTIVTALMAKTAGR